MLAVDRQRMSAAPDNELDLEKLFLPAWAQEPSSATKYAKYEGGERRIDVVKREVPRVGDVQTRHERRLGGFAQLQ